MCATGTSSTSTLRQIKVYAKSNRTPHGPYVIHLGWTRIQLWCSLTRLPDARRWRCCIVCVCVSVLCVQQCVQHCTYSVYIWYMTDSVKQPTACRHSIRICIGIGWMPVSMCATRHRHDCVSAPSVRQFSIFQCMNGVFIYKTIICISVQRRSAEYVLV